jgi:hypothetical protein
MRAILHPLVVVVVMREVGGDRGYWLWHPGVPRRWQEESGVVRFGAGTYCVSGLLLLPLLVCLCYEV